MELPQGLSLFCTWKAFLTLEGFPYSSIRTCPSKSYLFFFLFFKVQPLAIILSIKLSLSSIISSHFSIQNFHLILYVPLKKKH